MFVFDRIKKWYLIKPITISVVVLLSYLVLQGYSPSFRIMRLKAQDVFSQIRYKLKPLPQEINNIVIVCIDDRSYEDYNKKWPWGREVFTVLMYKLMECKPKAIGLNLAFIGQSNRKEIDMFLADAFREAGNVVVASYFDEEGWYHPPEKIFQDAVQGYGFTNRPKDSDGVTRLVRLFNKSVDGEVLEYSFELRLLELFFGAHMKDVSYQNGKYVVSFENNGRKVTIPAKPDGIIKLQYFAKPKDFLSISIIDVLSGDVLPNTLKDKIVLVGMTSRVFQDNHPTPLGIMSGAAIIGNAFVSLVREDFVITLPRTLDYLLILLICIAFGIITYRHTLLRATLYVAGFLMAFLAISVLLAFFGLEWDFFSVPFITLLVFIVINVYKYARLLIEGMVLRRVIITDPITGLATKRYLKVKLQHDLKKAISEKGLLALVVFTIDNFEQLTTGVGIDKIDEIIKELGRIILRNSRRSRGIDFVSRYGEREFCVILHKTGEKGAMIYIRRIQKAVSVSRLHKGIEISLSAGVAVYPVIKTRSSEALIASAVTALKRDEKQKSGGINFYDPQKDEVHFDRYKDDSDTMTLTSEIDMDYIISDMEERNKELVEALRNLRKAHSDIIKTERIAVMGKVTAQIHHELNKPLGNLKDSLEIIQNELKGSPDSGKYVELALKEVDRMTGLNNELRDFYRPARKEMVEVNLHGILDEMLDLSKKHLMVNRVKLNKGYDEQLPRIKGYPEELKQVFLNMIINAIDSMPEGGELAVLTKVSYESKIVEVHIKDTGCGIAPENMDKLFKPFFTTKDESKGSGLGLYASGQIIENHGGKIDVQSEVGKGTTFIIKLPF